MLGFGMSESCLCLWCDSSAQEGHYGLGLKYSFLISETLGPRHLSLGTEVWGPYLTPEQWNLLELFCASLLMLTHVTFQQCVCVSVWR